MSIKRIISFYSVSFEPNQIERFNIVFNLNISLLESKLSWISFDSQFFVAIALKSKSNTLVILQLINTSFSKETNSKSNKLSVF